VDLQDIRIQPARPADYPRLTALWTAAGLSYRPAGRDSKQAFEQRLRLFPDLFLLAINDDQLVGSVFGTHDGRKGWINRLAIEPNYRRRGVGSALVTACDHALRRLGIEIVAALIEPENEASLALFAKLGYLPDAPVVYVRKLSRPGI
jgi:ribosomal protein S18 acetylase RimI-like enzyme